MRRRAAQLAVADARQAAKRRGVGEVYRAQRAAFRRRGRDAGEQVVRIVEVRLAARRIRGLGDLSFRGVVGERHGVLHGIAQAAQPGLLPPGNFFLPYFLDNTKTAQIHERLK